MTIEFPDAVKIIDINVHVTNLASAVDVISDWAERNMAAYVCVANVHMCMEAHDDNAYEAIVNGADLVVADGMPLVWFQKIIGERCAQRIRGADLMDSLCEVASKRSINIGLFGSTNATLKNLKEKITVKYPEIKITYAHSPPFRTVINEPNEVIEEINKADVKILFVALGCPKQEIWMSINESKLNCVQIGVGAAFDFLAGEKKIAPYWMQRSGLEWLFRLMSEPRRLAWRYVKHNPRFILLSVLQIIPSLFKKQHV